ncbi:MAG: hypothetical protein ACT4NY_29015 [Pseudonocardiales bacterium]
MQVQRGAYRVGGGAVLVGDGGVGTVGEQQDSEVVAPVQAQQGALGGGNRRALGCRSSSQSSAARRAGIPA